MDDDTIDRDDQVSALFHNSTTDLQPDVAALVQGSIDRGRGKRRRHAIGTAAVAAVAVAGIVGIATSVSPSIGSGGVDPAGAAFSTPSTAPTPSAVAKPSNAPKPAQPSAEPTKGGSPPPPATADIPVKAADLPRLFTKLYPGKVTPAEERTGRIIDNGKQGQYAHFLWKGFTTTVGFAAYAGTPVQRCRELQKESGSVPRLTCAKRPDGTVLLTWREVAPARDGGGVAQSASLLTKDGYEIFIVSYNSARKEGPNLAPQPPLSIAKLTAAVTSNVWF